MITWSKEKFEAIDIKTRMILTMHEGFTLNSATSGCKLHRKREAED